ncbi:MAG TPA: hypothetical protein VMB46_09005 [Methanomassiliicoccales archaeon]|nr:hypothetical protein [Methanomassiliicoccales archaeon]
MVKIKICGLMSPGDVEAARTADYNGFIVESKGLRNLTLEKAKELMTSCRTKRVMVTSSDDAVKIAKSADRLQPDVIQIHSQMSLKDIGFVQKRAPGQVWARATVGGGNEESRANALREVAHCVVLHCTGSRMGESRLREEWAACARIARSLDPYPVVLAGGLNPLNVGYAVQSVQPFCVDVCRGVDAPDKSKDPMLVAEFIERARNSAKLLERSRTIGKPMHSPYYDDHH